MILTMIISLIAFCSYANNTEVPRTTQQIGNPGDYVRLEIESAQHKNLLRGTFVLLHYTQKENILNMVQLGSTIPAIASINQLNPSTDCIVVGGATQCNFTVSVHKNGTVNMCIVGQLNRDCPQISVSPIFSCIKDNVSGNTCGCLLQNDGSGLIWYNPVNGGSISQFTEESAVLSEFNSSSHCGYTDWRIPTLSTIDENNYYFGAPGNRIDNTTDFAKLGNYAIANGFASQGDLTAWLNSNGFSLPTDCSAILGCYYWSSSVFQWPMPTYLSWVVNMSNGFVSPFYQLSNAYLLPVRGGQ